MTSNATIGGGTSAFFDRARMDMNALRRAAEKTQQRLSTGERLERSSDNPVAASRLRILARSDRLAEVDKRNADRLSDDLSIAASALQNMADDLTRARELALWASNDTISSEQRAIIGNELQQLHTSLLANANARSSTGHATFGGQTGGPAYVTDASGAAIYAGTPASGTSHLGDRQTVERGPTGPEATAFTLDGQQNDIFALVKGLGDALVAGSGSAAAREALAGFDAGLEVLTRAQTVVGTRLAWVETVQSRQQVTAQGRAEESNRTGGVDIASAVTELQQLLLALEASQAGFAKLGQLSLFNSIR